MNADEKNQFVKLYKEIVSIMEQAANPRYGQGRTFVAAVEIIDRTRERMRKYGIEATYPLSAAQITLIERAIEEAHTALQAERERREADRAEQAQLRAEADEKKAAVDARSDAEKHQDANRAYWQRRSGFRTTDAHMEMLAREMEIRVTREYRLQLVEQREAQEEIFAIAGMRSPSEEEEALLAWQLGELRRERGYQE